MSDSAGINFDPISGKLNFAGSGKVNSVQIYDLNGRLQQNQNGRDIKNMDVTLQTDSTYAVRVRAGKEVKMFKIIKKIIH